MPWKVDDDGHIVQENGNPVWINAKGEEAPFDAEHALGKIASLTSENSGKRKSLEQAQAKLKLLDGIEDPEEFLQRANAALETVQKLDGKKMIDAGEVDKLKAQIAETYEGKLKEKDKALSEREQEIAKRDQQIYGLMVGHGFANSAYIKDAMAVPSDLAEAKFGRHFKVEDGRVVARWEDNEPIYSRTKPGELADFDEALAQIVDKYPHKDSILKGSGASGSGAPPSQSGGKAGAWSNIQSVKDFRNDREKSLFIRDRGLDAFESLPME